MKFAKTQDALVIDTCRADPATIYPHEYAAQFVPCSDEVETGWVLQNEVFLPPEPAPLSDRQSQTWDRIKAERDRRKSLGVKVGQHWYHSDADSRIQQISLFVMGASVPPIQWKTLTTSPPPVFVTMTPALAAGIFQGTAASDAAVFAAAEAHRVAMEASSTPESYDCSVGWPESIEDAS